METMISERIIDLTTVIKSKERYYAYMVWNTATRYGISLREEDIEDIISDAYLLAVSKLRSNPKLSIQYPGAWFSRIVFLTCLNELRKRHTKKDTVDIEGIDELNDMNFIYETLDTHLDQSVLRAVMDETLSTEEKEILLMSVEGMSYDEIRKTINANKPEDIAIQNSALRQIKSRAIKKLKAKLL